MTCVGGYLIQVVRLSLTGANEYAERAYVAFLIFGWGIVPIESDYLRHRHDFM